MIVYGYAKSYKYMSDGTLLMRVRIPSIHGPYNRADAKGKAIKLYTPDEDLPYYTSLLLPYLPTDGEVVALVNTGPGNSEFIVIGLTGSSYSSGFTNLGE